MLLWTFPSESFNLNMWTKARTKSPSCAALPTSFNFPRTTNRGHMFESPGWKAVLRGFAIFCLSLDKCH